LRTWIQPVVVLWGTFDQVSIHSRNVAWVRGKDLARVLAGRPIALSTEEAARATAILRSTPPPEHDLARDSRAA
jgi:hypothetical protein